MEQVSVLRVNSMTEHLKKGRELAVTEITLYLCLKRCGEH